MEIPQHDGTMILLPIDYNISFRQEVTQIEKRNILEIKRSEKSTSGKVVIPIGFEPMTYCLEGSCSIQLSYGTQWP